ncbi:hypothetical protein BC830DRAFT_1128987 [Chytriomyces sp. MP71]|nr:hypothetical protein BC830DRAFT_1128987 [Chytriomyces sp. MP71]
MQPLPAPIHDDSPSATDSNAQDHAETVTEIPPRISVPYSLAPSDIGDRHLRLRHRTLPSSTSTASHPSSSTNPPPKPEKEPAKLSQESSGVEAGADNEVPPTAQEEEGGLYECNICLDMASNPVVTLCGHLFCWPCLHRWMASGNRASNACPVCKAGIEKDKLIPIYAKGRTIDPRNTVPDEPERPAGQRPEAIPRLGGGFGFHPFFGGLPGAQFQMGGTNVHFSAGFGPLGLLLPLVGYGIQYLAGRGVGGVGATGAAGRAGNVPGGFGNIQQDERMARVVAQQAFISRLFMLISALVFVAIVLY